jgi:hypothetical protein
VKAWELLPGETPIDRSGLKRKGITKRAGLNRAEAANIRKAVVKYLAAKPSGRSAPFTLTWVKRVHKQMFGDVWRWAGNFRPFSARGRAIDTQTRRSGPTRTATLKLTATSVPILRLPSASVSRIDP